MLSILFGCRPCNLFCSVSYIISHRVTSGGEDIEINHWEPIKKCSKMWLASKIISKHWEMDLKCVRHWYYTLLWLYMILGAH